MVGVGEVVAYVLWSKDDRWLGDEERRGDDHQAEQCARDRHERLARVTPLPLKYALHRTGQRHTRQDQPHQPGCPQPDCPREHRHDQREEQSHHRQQHDTEQRRPRQVGTEPRPGVQRAQGREIGRDAGLAGQLWGHHLVELLALGQILEPMLAQIAQSSPRGSS